MTGWIGGDGSLLVLVEVGGGNEKNGRSLKKLLWGNELQI